VIVGVLGSLEIAKYKGEGGVFDLHFFEGGCANCHYKWIYANVSQVYANVTTPFWPWTLTFSETACLKSHG
jgi:hypothetical protein